MPMMWSCPHPGCGAPSPTRGGCAKHPPRRSRHGHRSPDRDRATQARFRKLVLERDSHTCQGCPQIPDCGRTTDLRACHIVPLAQGGSNHSSNGITRCRRCDLLTDPHAT